MARRRNQGLAEDIVEIISKLPWWVGAILAVVIYFILHHFAIAKIPHATGIKGAGSAVTAQMWKTLATFGQYLLPAVFLIGALLSAKKEPKYKTQISDELKNLGLREPSIHASSTKGDLYEIYKSTGIPVKSPANELGLELLRAIDWKLFEEVCAEYFRICGFHATTQSHGPDGGIDIRLYARNDTSKIENLVQCKRWTNWKVGPKEIRELLGVMTDAKVTRGTFITTSSFNDEAHKFAKANRIHLIDGKEFLEDILARSPDEQQRLLAIATKDDYLTPSCPNCGTKLKEKQNKKDQSKFWACPHYPNCRYTLAIAN